MDEDITFEVNHVASESESGGDYIADLIAELDDRSAADDERLWLNEDAQAQQADGVGESGSMTNRFTSSTLPIDVRHIQPTRLASTRTPLTRAQLEIASELVVLNQSPTNMTIPYNEMGEESNRSAIIPSPSPSPSSFSTLPTNDIILQQSYRFQLIHPLWIASGRERFEKLQQSKREALDAQAANASKVNMPFDADSNIATPPTTIPSQQQAAPVSTSRMKSISQSASRGSSRAGREEEGGITNTSASTRASKRASLELGQTLLPPTSSNVPVQHQPTRAQGLALNEVRFQRTQDALQLSRRIPLSKVSPIPLLPDSEYWSLLIQRQVTSNSERLELSWSEHSIDILTQRSNMSQSKTNTYSFDGQPFYSTFEEGNETPISKGGVLDDTLRTDRFIWEKMRESVIRDLLQPLGLSSNRLGWRHLCEELIPFETCGRFVQMMRTIFDLEGRTGYGAGTVGTNELNQTTTIQ